MSPHRSGSETVFWALSDTDLLHLFRYAIYLGFTSACAESPHSKVPSHPNVSIVIAARNEEARLPANSKILPLDYPPEQIQIIVASDGSTDRTASIRASRSFLVILNEIQGEGERPQ